MFNANMPSLFDIAAVTGNDRVTVVNTGTTDIVISANPMLAISKMCG